MTARKMTTARNRRPSGRMTMNGMAMEDPTQYDEALTPAMLAEFRGYDPETKQYRKDQ